MNDELKLLGHAYKLAMREWEWVADNPVAKVSRERVRNQIEAGAVRRLQSNLGLAFQLAESESMHGDWRETFRASARLGEVEPDDVRRVAARYLVRENRTVATLMRRRDR